MIEANVLIIEDDLESVAILENTLKGVGYRVWVVSDPQEAIRLLQQTKFALVITELHFARMNGIEVTRQVHNISPATNVIVITFYSFIGSAIEAMEAGAYHYITKPLNTSEIRLVCQYGVERFLLLSSDKEKEYYAKLASIDGLTGLYNRRRFRELMNYEFTRLKRYASKVSVLMIDIDNFKNYNDTYGHPAGDELLRKLSGVLKTAVREADVVGRYGGEEFVVMLPQTDKNGAQIVAERLRVQASLYLPSTISMGVATFPDDAPSEEVLIEKADVALYKAKQTGKNKYCVA